MAITNRRTRQRLLSIIALVAALGASPCLALTPAQARTAPQPAWGAQHGVARVHSTVSVTPPPLPSGSTVTFTWKIGTTYIVGTDSRTFAWADLGKSVLLKVLVRSSNGAGTSKWYGFGHVLPPILVSVHVQLMRSGGTSNPAPPSKISGAVAALTSDGTRAIATSATDSTGAATVRVPPGTYQFAGHAGTSGPWGCRASGLTKVTAGTTPSVVVTCHLP